MQSLFDKRIRSIRADRVLLALRWCVVGALLAVALLVWFLPSALAAGAPVQVGGDPLCRMAETSLVLTAVLAFLAGVVASLLWRGRSQPCRHGIK